MKLLYAEDEKSMSEAVVDILTYHKYIVDAVYDGQDALDYAFAESYDGIILDIMMPGKDGFAVLKTLRQKGINTPVLLLTAKAEVEDRIAGLDMGADDYLPKPFAMGELLARVRAMLRRRETFTPDILKCGSISLNMQNYELSNGKQSFVLPKLEYQLMEILMLNRDIRNELSGKIDGFEYMVRDSRMGFGKAAVFLDTSGDIYSCIRVLFLSAAIGIACWLLMLLFVILLSRQAIRPIAENMEKQKQFVTDAGHEMKTPVAIIQSNTEAMELYNGENKWSKNIKEQTVRLNELMKNLLTLARMDELSANLMQSDILLSQLLTDHIECFRETLELCGVSLQTHIQPMIFFRANREHITQLISVLMDNAVKYTNEGGNVSVLLERNDKRIKMQFKNTCQQLPPAPPDKLFDRFYRGDEARTQKNGGYGIGLSVARSVTEAYRGRISAEYEADNTIVFTVCF